MMNTARISKDKISYARYPIIETKRRLTEEENKAFSMLIQSPEQDWHLYIEDYHQFVKQAESNFVY